MNKYKGLRIKFINGLLFFYKRKLAKNGDICLQLNHGAMWKYSNKDPGSGIENILIRKINLF